MKRSGGLVLALVVMLGMSAPLLAAGSAPRCAEIFDDAQRLACYDAQFGKPVRPASPPPAITDARPAVPPQPVPAPSAAPVENKIKATPPPAKPRDEVITARVALVSRITNDRFQVTLDSGQVWTQIERDPNAEVAVGDTVKIRPAMLGSWMLETRGGVRTRVRSAP